MKIAEAILAALVIFIIGAAVGARLEDAFHDSEQRRRLHVNQCELRLRGSKTAADTLSVIRNDEFCESVWRKT